MDATCLIGALTSSISYCIKAKPYCCLKQWFFLTLFVPSLGKSQLIDPFATHDTSWRHKIVWLELTKCLAEAGNTHFRKLTWAFLRYCNWGTKAKGVLSVFFKLWFRTGLVSLLLKLSVYSHSEVQAKLKRKELNSITWQKSGE